MKILVSHPTGNANVRATIEAFAKRDMLDAFETTIATNPDAFWLKFLPASLRFELLRRSYAIDPNLIQSTPIKEIGRLGFSKAGLKQFTKHEFGKFSVDAVYAHLDKSVAKRLARRPEADLPNVVYTYEDGALNTFEQAANQNVTRVYDLPKGYWRAERELLNIERDARPDWAMTLAGFIDSDEKLRRKDLEIEKAQHIIVASSFTKRTLEYFPGEIPPVSVIPYGFPPTIEARDYSRKKGSKLKLLFVGQLSQLKGLANVLEAVDELEDSVELTIVGRKSNENCKPLNEGIQKHRYIPSLAHHEVLREMANHDILLFPSLFEGFGLVVTEAMSQGTPVIATTRTCGADVITPGVNGWITEPGSTRALIRQIKLILENPNQIESVGKAAIEKARTRPWSQYGDELVAVVTKLLKKQ